jgi:phenylalanyl-tRNA synthetase beta chain
MKVPLSWLAHYVSLPPEHELLPRLTAIGHMLDGLVQLPGGQQVVSLEIRQNRPDCLSILGLAREVGAAFSSPVIEVPLAELPSEIHQSDADTPDYVCFLHIKGARLERLPHEMLTMLEQYGQACVNPFVDLSNYVMVELGQPLHVYAASEIDIMSAHSRPARRDETLTLLTGETVSLTEQDLVIADRAGPLSLAGILGGNATKVVSTSADIIVEAGNFRPALVRRTARRHGLTTEASQRSSKLLAPGLVPVALQRFLALLVQYGAAGETALWQAGSVPERSSEPIVLDHRDLERLSGMHIAVERARDMLTSLGFQAEVVPEQKIAALPPWWRTDVAHPADLIEEVLRIHGYSHIPLERLDSMPPPSTLDSVWEQEEMVRNILCAWGYDEAILDAFLVDRVGDFEKRPDVVRVENSPTGEMDLLRPSLVPNLLSSARFLPFLLPQRRLFEIGRTFHLVSGQPVEARTAAWVLMIGSGPSSWHQRGVQPDFYTLKAEAEAVLEALGSGVSVETSSFIPFPFQGGKSCCLREKSGEIMGYVGEVEHQAYGATPVRMSFAVEIYLPPPTGRQEKRLRTARREADSFDISLQVDEQSKVAMIQERIEQVLGQDLVTVRLIDVYGGKQLKAGARSFTFRVVYDRRRGEPGMIWREVGNAITHQFSAEVRGASR